MLTVYQCITMESWTKVLYWVSECFNIVSMVFQFQFWGVYALATKTFTSVYIFIVCC